ncbi:hypothetical protein CYMTET_8922 [Cymbomonas tetramitiformis]|uniref:Uncharacterized protein n=1 Tax=Cymbomonas tetramitiformis TaxID=36881 RepID=A0AAE0LFM5_9CHLO|nr:hypothetical protein CYMTET_8922 [Cymbomonas tetramitiformis]
MNNRHSDTPTSDKDDAQGEEGRNYEQPTRDMKAPADPLPSMEKGEHDKAPLESLDNTLPSYTNPPDTPTSTTPRDINSDREDLVGITPVLHTATGGFQVGNMEAPDCPESQTFLPQDQRRPKQDNVVSRGPALAPRGEFDSQFASQFASTQEDLEHYLDSESSTQRVLQSCGILPEQSLDPIQQKNYVTPAKVAQSGFGRSCDVKRQSGFQQEAVGVSLGSPTDVTEEPKLEDDASESSADVNFAVPPDGEQLYVKHWDRVKLYFKLRTFEYNFYQSNKSGGIPWLVRKLAWNFPPLVTSEDTSKESSVMHPISKNSLQAARFTHFQESTDTLHMLYISPTQITITQEDKLSLRTKSKTVPLSRLKKLKCDEYTVVRTVKSTTAAAMLRMDSLYTYVPNILILLITIISLLLILLISVRPTS